MNRLIEARRSYGMYGNQLWASEVYILELESALLRCLDEIKLVAEQQAMTDDSWQNRISDVFEWEREES
jgi:hypothetical protein